MTRSRTAPTVLLVVPVTVRPVGAAGYGRVPLDVVALTLAECADSPAELVAVTLNV